MLFENPSAIANDFMLVALFVQFKKHVRGFADVFNVLALSQITHYRFRIPINNIFFVRNPIIAA